MDPTPDGRPEAGVRRASATTASACWPWQPRTSGKQICSKEDERDLVLRGYVAFLDPPKDTAARALAALQKHGVAVKILTGDNDLISRKVCKDVGLRPTPCSWAATSRRCPTPNWPRRRRRRRSSPASLPPTRSASSAPSAARPRRRIHGRRHQRRSCLASRGRRHLGGHRDRHRQGIGRPDLA